MTKENKTHMLKIEKTIATPPSDVFRAIGEGRLFVNCSADHESLKVDFRVGGKYSIEFINFGMKNCGEFLEIVPNKKIIFTWCQDYAENPIPDTKVVVELKDLGGKTALTLTHSGFTDKENKDAHQGGWTGGLDDLGAEMTEGKLRLVRKFNMPVEKLFEECKKQNSFLKIKGSIVETEKNKKLVFKCEPGHTTLTLLFETEDDGSGSWLELIHEGITKISDQMSQRGHWDTLLKTML